jgi:hypothetical protein
MAITPLPTAPSRADPTNFSARADDFMTALPTFASECNATAVAMTLNATNSTSTTSLAIGLGSKSLTVQTGKSYVAGMTVKIASTASPTNWMLGDITSYVTGTGALVVNVIYTGGSGTIAAWTLSQSVAATGDATLTRINGGQLAGLRNRIINGDMRIAQRGVSTTAPIGNVAYTLDRWMIGTNTTTTIATQSSQASFPYNYMQINGTAGNTGITVRQRIESVNIRDLAGQAVTLSFYFYNSGGNAPSGLVRVNYPTAVDNYAAVTQISSTAITVGVATKQTLTLTLPAGAYTGLEIIFEVPSCTTGVMVFHTVQIEGGSVATPFEIRPIGMELALCQRYYERSSAIVNQIAASSQHLANAWFKVTKRVSPTSIVYTSPVGGAAGKGYNYSTSLDIAATTQGTGTDMITVTLQTTVSAGNNIAFNYTAEAEL